MQYAYMTLTQRFSKCLELYVLVVSLGVLKIQVASDQATKSLEMHNGEGS